MRPDGDALQRQFGLTPLRLIVVPENKLRRR